MLKVLKKKFRVHSITGRITNKVMLKAFKAVKKNRGAAGIDKESIAMFESNLEENLAALKRELKSGTYIPIPLRRVYIPKSPSQFRPLGIPAVRCRIAQEVVRYLITPIFERIFHDNSHGFRKYHSCHSAVKQLLEYYEQGYWVLVDADIKGFFDNIAHKLIIDLVASEISDGNILSIVKKFLQAGVMEDGKILPTRKGTPQGGNISPLLANIVLNHFDWIMEKHGLKFVRYADDFIILCKSKFQAEKALLEVKKCIEGDLNLTLHPEKTKIVTFGQGFEFLGYYISARTIRMSPKAEKRFKDKVREIFRRSHNLETKVISKANSVIRGTVNYFWAEYTTYFRQFTELDKWIRKRLRCMKFKRIWRTDNIRLKNRHIKRMGLISCRELCLAKG
jgi:group II intron reverse transcriptase/maturase